jgi:hypothetical protein
VTTPEKHRRAQLVIGGAVLVLGLFTTSQAILSSQADNAQQDCFERNFREFARVLDARADIQARESVLIARIWQVYTEAAGVLQDDPTKELPPKEEARLQTRLVEALLDYDRGIEAIQQDREENPIPPYPVGTCD